MKITECVPLAGRGLVARRGHLVALTDGMDAGPDPLLTVLTAVAYANGDGAALVLAGTRAAAEHGGRPAWACAGVTFGEEVAVLVHGEAVALVSVDGSPEAQVTASGSMIPVVGTFTGAVVTVRLVIGPPAPPDPRLWLEAGTVFGGGCALTVKQEKTSNLIPNDSYASVAATMRPAMDQAVGNMVFHPSTPGPAVPAPPGVAPGEVYPEDLLPEPVPPLTKWPTRLAMSQRCWPRERPGSGPGVASLVRALATGRDDVVDLPSCLQFELQTVRRTTARRTGR
jgi:hypothetical protein